MAAPIEMKQSFSYGSQIYSIKSRSHGSHLEFENQIHAVLAKWIDVIEDECCDDVKPIGFMVSNTVL